jgi:glycosyltransferase involved in cell wall biosynthesis
MGAFPAVLRAIPNAKLIVAGANHHTKAGYWESIREAQPPDLPIEFRGYVPEEDIPELFRTTSVLVLPYDSATGSSGPAHQACEYGVPIVGADIEDFRDMAADEDMAVRFYKVGDAADLANQLITVLRSPELQRSMGRQNFAAGLEMTIGSVVRNYLRWFELNKCKKALLNSPANSNSWLRSLFSSSNGTARTGSLAQESDGGDGHHHQQAGSSPQPIDFVDPFA